MTFTQTERGSDKMLTYPRSSDKALEVLVDANLFALYHFAKTRRWEGDVDKWDRWSKTNKYLQD